MFTIQLSSITNANYTIMFSKGKHYNNTHEDKQNFTDLKNTYILNNFPKLCHVSAIFSKEHPIKQEYPCLK